MATTSMESTRRESLSLDTSSIRHSTALLSATSVQRWDGNNRVATEWNSLRRDSELWFDEGDCYVYLYGPGRSQRGPSFCIPYDLLEAAGCHGFLESNLIATWDSSPYQTSSPGGDSYLFLPAPSELSRVDAFNYHVDTRNFFAWVAGAPLVGKDPVSALVGLKDRLEEWYDHPDGTLDALVAYIKEQGYCDVPEPVETSYGQDEITRMPSLPKRRPSFAGFMKRPLRMPSSRDMTQSTKRRFTTSLFGGNKQTIAPYHHEDVNYDNRRASQSSDSTAPSLTHSRDESLSSSASTYSDSYTSSPVTPVRPSIPMRNSSFEKTKLDMNGKAPMVDVHVVEDSRHQESMINALLEEIANGHHR